jgi:NDP-sugar pyrophosphorylase family protein
VKAVVLVGGEGTRLRPLTYSTPKPMLPVAEVLMIERVVTHLADHGIDEVILSLGYKPDAFIAAFPEGSCAGVKLTYAVEPQPLDTAGGIAFAARLADLHETFLVMNGDVLSDVDLSVLVALHRQSGAEATISLTPVEDPSAFGVVQTDGKGRVTAFVEKPAREEAPTNFINAGFYVFEPSMIDRVPVDGVMHLESEVFPRLVEAGSLFAAETDAYWTDTGTPDLYLQANLDYARGLRGVAPAPGAKERDRGIWTLGAGVLEGQLVGPSLIGDAVFVASAAHVEQSVLGAGARLEAGAVVRNSLLLPGAVVGAGATVEGSILGEGAAVGEGASLTGLSVVEGRATVDANAVVVAGRVERAR